MRKYFIVIILFFKHYQINIQHLEQPLLVILPSAKDKRRGADKPILLVPELCVLTGEFDLKIIKKRVQLKAII